MSLPKHATRFGIILIFITMALLAACGSPAKSGDAVTTALEAPSLEPVESRVNAGARGTCHETVQAASQVAPGVAD